MIVKIALRNTLRQRRRTLLTVLTMVGGFSLCAVSFAWSDGAYNEVIEMFTRNRLGHVQLHHTGYLDRPALYKNISDYEAIGRTLDSLQLVESWTPRVFSAGLISVGERATGGRLIGIDPTREDSTTRFSKKVTDGRNLSVSASHEAVLGKGLADVLDAQIGDSVIILTQGADGSIANDMYDLVGLVESGDKISDRTTVYIHIKDAQELLVLDDRVHEIAVVATELGAAEKLVKQIRAKLSDSTIEVASWKEFAKSFYRAMEADKQGNWFILMIIVIVVAVGVLNTVLMSVLERIREYGLLRAIGTSPGEIVRLVVTEVGIMAIAGLIIGSIIASVAIAYLTKYGITMGDPIQYGGVVFESMHAEFNLRSYTIPGICVFSSAVIVGFFPAIKAARISPAQSMRMN